MAMAIKIDQIQRSLIAGFKCGVTVEYTSAPGIGKTTMVHRTAKNMARLLQQPFAVCVRVAATVDPSEAGGIKFIGMRRLPLHSSSPRFAEFDGRDFETAVDSYPALFPNEEDTVYMPDGSVTTIRALGFIPRFGIIFLDELRQGQHEVRKPMARLMEEQRINNWALNMFGGRWSVIAASNTAEHKSGATKELAFETNRKCIMPTESDTVAVRAFLQEMNYPDMFVGYVSAFPGSIFTEKVPAHDDPFPTPRSYEKTIKMLLASGDGKKPDTSDHAVHIVAGLMGEGRAHELVGYLRREGDMVTRDEIVKNPETARISERPDVNYAVAQMLTRICDKKIFPKIFQYLLRMQQDILVITMAGIKVKMPEVSFDPVLKAWELRPENQPLLMQIHAADRRLHQ